jgi:two-component system cell cycle response regulator
MLARIKPMSHSNLSMSLNPWEPEAVEAPLVARPDTPETSMQAEPGRSPAPPCGPDLLDVPSRVLLVEPSASERWWLRNELLAGQVEVFEASDVISAVRAIPIYQPNLILSQLRLPTYSGLELVRRLKEDHETQSIPVLLYADLATAEERVRAFDLGAGDFVSKPFVGAELLARVRSALRTRHLLTMLERRARLDGLTGLANRGVLEARLPREWEACRRRGIPMAVLISDLDHFKTINDTHGHAAGDEVLRQAASSLARAVRSSDLVARYGGEEFVVVAPDCDLAPALGLAERFRTAILGLEIVEHGARIPITTSVGVAACRDAGETTPAELLRRADEALYRAKESGRNATSYWDPGRDGPALLEASPLPGDGPESLR